MLERRFGGEGMRRGARGRPSYATGSSPAPETHRVAGSAAGTSTVSGLVTADGAVVGSAAGTSSVAGAVTAHGAVAGTAAGTSTVSGTAFAHGAVAGSAAGTSTVSGTVTATSGASLITANRTLHWDASDSGNTVVSGEITVLTDLSGTGNHGTPLSGDVGAELLAADQNGLDVASYNGTDESNAKADPTGMPERTDNRTVYWVGRAPDTGSDIFCFVYGVNGTHLGWVMIMDQNTPDKMLLNIINEVHDSTADSFDEWAVWAVQYDDTAGVDIVRFFKNGVAVGTSSPTNMFTSTAPDLAAVGANIAEGNSPQKLGEVVVYAAAHDSSEIDQNTAYFGAKWGITIP